MPLTTVSSTALGAQASPVKLDDHAAPDDNTDLNASATKHGLLPKLSNVATEFLTGTGTWAVPAGGAGASATTVEANLGATWATEGRFTITDAAITGTSKVLCWQAPGPYTGKGTRADEAAMQPVQVVAVEPATGSATVYWQTPPIVVMSRVQNNVSKLSAAGATFDRLHNQRWPDVFEPKRIGKVKGNVKFSYMVLS